MNCVLLNPNVVTENFGGLDVVEVVDGVMVGWIWPQVKTILGAQAVSKSGVPSSAFFGCKSNASANVTMGVAKGKSRVVAEAEPKKVDRWSGLGTDISDDQQDIQRGKGMVDALFQGATGMGTQNVVMSSYDYISTAQRTYVHFP